MLAKLLSGAVLGVDAYPVSVEVDAVMGLPVINVVGLPGNAVKEARNRIESAVRNVGFDIPMKRVTINLAPADVKKGGSGFDLPMAIGLVAAAGGIRETRAADCLFLGELSLDGRLRPVPGALPVADLCRRDHIRRLVVPRQNAQEASVVPDVEVVAAEHLVEVLDWLQSTGDPTPYVPSETPEEVLSEDTCSHDFADVKGQEFAKRALEVAAAGGHNILMIGPPGSGKTMLAKRLAGILPPLSYEESIETTKIYSVMNLLGDQALMTRRPFRSPHHTLSDVALIGGGSLPRPGEVSLAHNGVLFLDELPEFRKNALEVLRQPLEEGQVTISRAAMSVSLPTRIILAAAMNPCPCGYATDPRRACTCSPFQVQNYRSRISGPLLDRIDIHVDVPSVRYAELSDERRGESSAEIARRVARARRIQQERFAGGPIRCNAHMPSRMIRERCRLGEESRRLLEKATDRLGLSARAYDRILRTARTIADLDEAADIAPTHLSEAIQYRVLDRNR